MLRAVHGAISNMRIVLLLRPGDSKHRRSLLSFCLVFVARVHFSPAITNVVVGTFDVQANECECSTEKILGRFGGRFIG